MSPRLDLHQYSLPPLRDSRIAHCSSLKEVVVFFTQLYLFLPFLIRSTHSNQDIAMYSFNQDGLEFCEAEVFLTDCPTEHVVVMTKAHYGRMQFGKCVQRSYGSVGCVADVLMYLDSICSGRRKCELRIPDQTLDKTKPCPVDLKTYLNVSYSCLEVESSACSMCREGGEGYAVVKTQVGYLGSVVSSEVHSSRSCGSVKCPWKIEVLKGQTINITLLDFAMEQRSSEDINANKRCYRYAVIKEKSHMKEAAVCGGKGRTQSIYHSVGNIIEIHIVSAEVFSRLGQFVLKYEAIGCSDPEIQSNAKFKRVKDYLEITCNDGQKWKAKCENNNWSGDFKMCSTSIIKSSFNSYIGPLSVAIITGIALVIAVLIVTIGIVCLKKQRTLMGQDTSPYIYPDHCHGYYGQYEPSILYADSGSLMMRKQTQQKAIYGHVTEIDIGRQNFYDVPKGTEKRPLPMLPETKTDVKKSRLEVKLDADSKSEKYQSVLSDKTERSNSCHPPKFPLQHYTVLEPNNFRDGESQSNEGTATPGDHELLTWVTPDPCSTIYCQASSSQGGSEEVTSNTELNSFIAGKEDIDDKNDQDTLNKITLRPVREGSVIAKVDHRFNPSTTVPENIPQKSTFTVNKSWP